jgi:hypothetical protein
MEVFFEWSCILAAKFQYFQLLPNSTPSEDFLYLLNGLGGLACIISEPVQLPCKNCQEDTFLSFLVINSDSDFRIGLGFAAKTGERRRSGMHTLFFEHCLQQIIMVTEANVLQLILIFNECLC